MERLGDSLNKFIKHFNSKVSLTTVIHIAIQLVGCIKKIHEYGYVFNDLKPDNILVGSMPISEYLDPRNQVLENRSSIPGYQLTMIDFGLVNKFCDEDGKHIKEGTTDKFRGSFMFAGLSAFKFYASSRKDDLVSLVYVLIFMLDYKRLTFINKIRSKSR